MKIIEENPYRILGVYSNSPTRERLANLNRMKAFLKVGKSVSFPLDLQQYIPAVSRTEVSIAEADAKLTLPKDQMLYGQFWFVKATPLDDVACNNLVAGEIDKAEEIWQKKECASSLQNLIVCALIRNDYISAVSYAEILYGNQQYVEQLVMAIVGTVGNFDVSNIAFSFLDVLCEEVQVIKLLSFISNDVWKKHIEIKVVKPLVESIQKSIDIAKKSREKGSIESLKAGENLKAETRKTFLQLKKILPVNDLQYQMIADKLGLELQQCCIDYYNGSDDPDAAIKAMELQKYAKSIVVGQMAKDKCNKNVIFLQDVIDNLPPEEVYEEDRAIQEELCKYNMLSREVCNAVILLHNTKPYLNEIKRKLGASNSYYLKISTQVVDNALNNIITDVNARQKNATKKSLKRKFREAIKAIKIMNTFDMQHDFRKNRFDKNKQILYDNYDDFDNSSKWQAALILHVVFVIIGSIVVCQNDNFDDKAYYWVIAIGAISWVYIKVDENNESSALLAFLGRGGCVGFLLILPIFLGYWIYKAIKELLNIIKKR